MEVFIIVAITIGILVLGIWGLHTRSVKRKAEEEAKAKRKAEEEAKCKAEEEAKRKAEEDIQYIDELDSRNWKVLESLNRSAFVKKYPDFDIAYLWTAYPDRNADNHRSANPQMLLEGLTKSKVKSKILSRLSCYYSWKRWGRVFNFAMSKPNNAMVNRHRRDEQRRK